MIKTSNKNKIDLSLSQESFRGIDPELRKCFFPDEGDLDLFDFYTQSNCQLECAWRYFSCISSFSASDNIFQESGGSLWMQAVAHSRH